MQVSAAGILRQSLSAFYKHFVEVGKHDILLIILKILSMFLSSKIVTASTIDEAAELKRLQELRVSRSQKDKSMALYIRTLKKHPAVLQEWNDTIWMVKIEKAIAHRNGDITFVFYNGTKIRVGEYNNRAAGLLIV